MGGLATHAGNGTNGREGLETLLLHAEAYNARGNDLLSLGAQNSGPTFAQDK